MSQRANSTLIGAFVLGGILLVAVAVMAATGGKLFVRKDRAVMHFSGSIYGLQVGAPVVFRGVRLGSVASVGMVYNPGTDSFSIPVVAELERNLIRSLDGKGADKNPALTLPALVAKGLRAQLAMQSLLTGQLYIDLDLRPDQPGQKLALAGTDSRTDIGTDSSKDSDSVEIPTTATAIQALKDQLEGMDFRRLVDDVAAIAGSARSVVAGPQLKQAMDDLAQITGSVRRLSGRLEQRVGPLADAAQGSLVGASKALGSLGSAADQVADTARRLGGTSDRVGALLAPDSALVQSLQHTAAELARTASALRQQTGEDAPLLLNVNRTLRDVSRAAQAVHDLADLLDQQPAALLRGRREAGPP